METSAEGAVAQVQATQKDFFSVTNERLKARAANEHLEAVLNAIQILTDGELDGFNGSQQRVEGGKITRETSIVGFHMEDQDETHTTVITIKDDKAASHNLLIESEEDEDGNLAIIRLRSNNMGDEYIPLVIEDTASIIMGLEDQIKTKGPLTKAQ